jgi:hypothetical protein
LGIFEDSSAVPALTTKPSLCSHLPGESIKMSVSALEGTGRIGQKRAAQIHRIVGGDLQSSHRQILGMIRLEQAPRAFSCSHGDSDEAWHLHKTSTAPQVPTQSLLRLLPAVHVGIEVGRKSRRMASQSSRAPMSSCSISTTPSLIAAVGESVTTTCNCREATWFTPCCESSKTPNLLLPPAPFIGCLGPGCSAS